MFELETLQIIWWALICIIFACFLLTNGFDTGIGIMLPFAAKTETEKRILINVLAPHWDGNQVWLVLAVGALFAAWPIVYATTFSLFYFPMMLALFCLFFRPVGFDYRNKIDDPRWKNFWDWGIFSGSTFPTFFLGLIVGNLFIGLPFSIGELERPVVTATFISLFNPFSVLSGLFCCSLLVLHGAAYSKLRTEGELNKRLSQFIRMSSTGSLILFIILGLMLWLSVTGLFIDSTSTIQYQVGGWLTNYQVFSASYLLPLLTGAALISACLFSFKSAILSFFASSLSIIFAVLTGATSLYPFVLPSSSVPSDSLTIFNGSSSAYTLKVMSVAVLFFVPLIFLYTAWCYRKLWGRLNSTFIKENNHSLY